MPWWREHQGWKIELVTERVGDAWVCQEIRITAHPKGTPPALLALDASFPSLLQALNAGEERARRWIDDHAGGASQLELPVIAHQMDARAGRKPATSTTSTEAAMRRSRA